MSPVPPRVSVPVLGYPFDPHGCRKASRHRFSAVPAQKNHTTDALCVLEFRLGNQAFQLLSTCLGWLPSQVQEGNVWGLQRQASGPSSLLVTEVVILDEQVSSMR